MTEDGPGIGQAPDATLLSRVASDGTCATLAWILALTGPILATAWLEPVLLPAVVGVFLAMGLFAVALRHLIAAWTVWLVLTGLSLEMTITDLAGPEYYQIAIAAAKGGEIGLVLLTMLRYGTAWDRFNPAFGFLGIAAMGAIAGMHPGLGIDEMLRSLAGSVTPFLLFFCAMPPGWGRALRIASGYVPLLSVGIGTVLDLTGIRPLFVDSGGARLAALGHPAFLAHVCLPAVYGCLLSWLRTASPGAAALAAINLCILFLTGARAPTAYAALVIAAAMLLARQAAMPFAHRLVLLIAGGVAVPVLLVLGETYSSLRLFAILSGDEAGHLSGRDILWPEFEAAAAQSPWVGWGLGAGNVIIPREGQIAQLLHTWAAHNEYLRMRVEGGTIGLGLLIVLFVLWVLTHTSRLPGLDRLTMRLVFLAFAAHAVTDNVLISTPACVFFVFIAAVFAEGRDNALPERGPVA